MAAQCAGRVDRLHHPVERCLVRERPDIGRADTVEDGGEAGAAGQIGAQDEGLGEEADQVVERRVGAARRDRAHRDVRPRAQPAEQARHGGVQGHEGRRPARRGELGEAGAEGGVEREGHRAAGVGGYFGQAVIRREGELRRCAAQRLAPVREFGRQGAVRIVLAAQRAALPQREVGVLQGQARQRRGVPGRPRPVRGGQIAEQGAQRVLVGGDVVDDEQQDVGVGGQGEEHHAPRDFGQQVEGRAGVGGQRGGQLVLVRRQDGEGCVGGFQNVLAGLAVGVGEDGTQALVAVLYVGDRGPQRLDVQRPGEPGGERDVVRRLLAAEPVQEPQAALGVRGGNARRARTGGRTERGRLPGPGSPGFRAVDQRRHPGDRRMLEEVAYRDRRGDLRAQPHDEPVGQQ